MIGSMHPIFVPLDFPYKDNEVYRVRENTLFDTAHIKTGYRDGVVAESYVISWHDVIIYKFPEIVDDHNGIPLSAYEEALPHVLSYFQNRFDNLIPHRYFNPGGVNDFYSRFPPCCLTSCCAYVRTLTEVTDFRDFAFDCHWNSPRDTLMSCTYSYSLKFHLCKDDLYCCGDFIRA